MSSEYRAKLGLLTAVELGAIALVALLVYLPITRSVSNSIREIDQLSERQAEISEKMKDNPDPFAQIEAIQAEMQRLDDKLPAEWRIGWLSTRIADTAREHHIDLVAASRWQKDDSATSPAELERMRKTLTVRCPTQALHDFLDGVSQLPFVVIVEDLAIERDERRGTVAADIELVTFVSPTDSRNDLGGADR